MIRTRRQVLTKLINIAYSTIVRHRFKKLGSSIDWRVEIANPEFISIGIGVAIRPYTWIYAITNDQGVAGRFSPSIEIKDGCSIGRFCHITASKHVTLESHVFVSEGVLITDSVHSYENIDEPVMALPLVSVGPLSIGEGSWIGDGCRIVGAVNVGRHCVIGANTFLNKSVPDYCVVAGAPARIIKRFDTITREWRSVDEQLT